MRLHGYCTGCRRIRLVSVSPHGLAMVAAGRGVPTGICDECEEKQDEKTASSRGRR